MPLEGKHILLGKNHRATNPKAYWLQMALRGGVRTLAAYILLTEG